MSRRTLLAPGATAAAWGIYLTYLTLWAVRRVEAAAGGRYRDGYAEGYIDGVSDRHPAPDRTLRVVRGQ